MNHSIHSADRATHLKVLIVAFAAATAVVALGMSSLIGATDGSQATVIKAGKPVVTTSNTTIVR